MSKAIVFGGSGFLGSHVADILSGKGNKVVIYDLKPSPYIKPDQTMVIGDILDFKKVKETVRGAQVIYNFAGIADVNEASEEPIKTIEQNILGNTYILEAIRQSKIERYIFASTVYVYSKAGSFYRTSKQACELYIEDYARKYGLPYTILRYGSLYGPRANETNPIYKLLEDIMLNKMISYWGNGEEIREYIHVEDAARCSVEILVEDFINKHVIITGHHPIKSKDLLTMINEMFGGKLPIVLRNENQSTHYQVTPYSFNPSIGRKYVSSYYLDMGQGLLQCIEELYKKYPVEERTASAKNDG